MLIEELEKKIIAFKTQFNREILLDNCAYFENEYQLSQIILQNHHHKIDKPIFKKEFTSNYINNEYFKLLTQ